MADDDRPPPSPPHEGGEKLIQSLQIDKPIQKVSYLNVLRGNSQPNPSPTVDPDIVANPSTKVINYLSVLKPTSIHQGKPSISFKKSEKTKLIAKLNHVLIAKFTHGRPRIAILKKFFADLKLKGEFNFSVVDSKHIFLECLSFEDYVNIWLKELWNIDGYPMRIFKWTDDFNPSLESPITPVWIHLPRLPLYFFDEEALVSIANAIGRPLKIDMNNINRIKLGCASICVEVDVSKPLMDGIWINLVEEDNTVVCESFWQKVVYDYIPPFCHSCNHLGHQEINCKRQIGESNDQYIDYDGKERRSINHASDERAGNKGNKTVTIFRPKTDESVTAKNKGKVENGLVEEVSGLGDNMQLVGDFTSCLQPAVSPADAASIRQPSSGAETPDRVDTAAVRAEPYVQKKAQRQNKVYQAKIKPLISSEFLEVSKNNIAPLEEEVTIEDLTLEEGELVSDVEYAAATGDMAAVGKAAEALTCCRLTRSCHSFEICKQGKDRKAEHCLKGEGRAAAGDAAVAGYAGTGTASGAKEPAADEADTSLHRTVVTLSCVAAHHSPGVFAAGESSIPTKSVQDLLGGEERKESFSMVLHEQVDGHEKGMKTGLQEQNNGIVMGMKQPNGMLINNVVQLVKASQGMPLQDTFQVVEDKVQICTSTKEDQEETVLDNTDHEAVYAAVSRADGEHQGRVNEEPVAGAAAESVAAAAETGREQAASTVARAAAGAAGPADLLAAGVDGVSSGEAEFAAGDGYAAEVADHQGGWADLVEEEHEQQFAREQNAILDWDATQVRAFVHKQIEEIKQEIGQTELKIRDTDQIEDIKQEIGQTDLKITDAAKNENKDVRMDISRLDEVFERIKRRTMESKAAGNFGGRPEEVHKVPGMILGYEIIAGHDQQGNDTKLPINFDPTFVDEEGTERLWSKTIGTTKTLLATRSLSPAGRSSNKVTKLRKLVDVLKYEDGTASLADKEEIDQRTENFRQVMEYKICQAREKATISSQKVPIDVSKVNEEDWTTPKKRGRSRKRN